MKIVMASLDDAGKTTTILTAGFDVERVRHRSLELTVQDIGGPYSGPDIKLRIGTVPEDIEEEHTFDAAVYPIGVYGGESRNPRGQKSME